jgi:large subunit ribosomal protein L25
MAELQTLRAEARAETGKNAARRIRNNGFVPGVLYGGQDAPQPLSIKEGEFTKHYFSGKLLSTLFMLEVGGEKTRVIPRGVEIDPVSDRPIHIDFFRLAEGARIALQIPVQFRGQEESPGLKKGGVLNMVRHTVELYCPADNIPHAIEADLSEADIGDSLHISAFTLPEGVLPVIQDRDFTVATVAPPTTFVEETPETEETEEIEGEEGEVVEGEETEGVEGEDADKDKDKDKDKRAEKK